jgi:hypothetical protein
MARDHASVARHAFGRHGPGLPLAPHAAGRAKDPPLRLASPVAFHDGLGPGQRRVMVGAVLAAHVVGVWALLQIREVRDAVAEAAPMFVNLIAPPSPPEPVRIESAPPAEARRRASKRAAEPVSRQLAKPSPGAGAFRRAGAAPPEAAGADRRARRLRRRMVRRRWRRLRRSPSERSEDHPGIGGPVPRADRARVPAPVGSATARPAAC